MLVLVGIMVIDGFFLGRKVNQLVDAKFPDNTESGWKLGFYAARSRLSAATDARAPAAGEPRRSGHLRSGARSGARRHPDRASPEWAETAIAASVGAECPVRYLATGATADDDDWSAEWPHTVLVDRNIGRRSKQPMWQGNCGPRAHPPRLSTTSVAGSPGRWTAQGHGPAARCAPISTTSSTWSPDTRRSWSWSVLRWA